MANPEHLAILNEALEKDDIEIWNKWRKQNPDIEPNLQRADLREANLAGIDFSNTFLYQTQLTQANLSGASLESGYLYGAILDEANLQNANLTDAKCGNAKLTKAKCDDAIFSGATLDFANLLNASLIRADFRNASLSGSTLVAADFTQAQLEQAQLFLVNAVSTNFQDADFSGANLSNSSFVEANLERANLSNCKVYGISIWNTKLKGCIQSNLTITRPEEPPITVDNLKIAQFIYLLLNNAEIRDVIDTMATKAVLILGRFKPERKVVLDAIKDDLRKRGFLPILFDFEKPDNRDLTETVRTLAHLSRFVIADLTEPSSIPHELANIVPQLPSVPVKPIILLGNREYAMIENLYRYPWMLPAHEYESQESLLAELAEKVIQPAQEKAEEMKPKSL